VQRYLSLAIQRDLLPRPKLDGDFKQNFGKVLAAHEHSRDAAAPSLHIARLLTGFSF